jgi:hypothetical protein
MSILTKYKGKYATFDPQRPKAFGICDRSGSVFPHDQLVKQLEWRGNSLIWTGLLVGKPFVDIPNQENRPIIPKIDPTTVKNPRPPEGYQGFNDSHQGNAAVVAELKKVRFNV